MGAWGFNLFQSDHDFDIISELDHDAGLNKLEEEAVKAAQHDPDDTRAARISFSLYGDLCSDIAVVRKHLDSGVLTTMLETQETRLLSGDRGDFMDEPGYKFLLIGACAMTLGCTIPPRFKSTMQKVYTCVGLPSGGVQQMRKALNGPDGFKDGEPYDFESLGLIETANQPKPPDQQTSSPFGWSGLNVHGPGTMFYQPPTGNDKELKQLQAKFKAKSNEDKHGVGVCGGCGAEEGEAGSKLLVCGKCKERKYCSKECQKTQWKAHKDVCKVAEMVGAL